MTEIISCDNCKAACCHNVHFEAWHVNVAVIEKINQLSKVLVYTPFHGEPSYLLEGWCPLLDGTKCSVHEDDNQKLSRECNSLQPGDKGCLAFRRRDGI